jgi:hypothetical protein
VASSGYEEKRELSRRNAWTQAWKNVEATSCWYFPNSKLSLTHWQWHLPWLHSVPF